MFLITQPAWMHQSFRLSSSGIFWQDSKFILSKPHMEQVEFLLEKKKKKQPSTNVILARKTDARKSIVGFNPDHHSIK